jgi:acetyl esterase/lipase
LNVTVTGNESGERSGKSDGRVRIEDDVAYGTGGGRTLRCDLFHPPEPGTNRPAVVLIHGGAWRQGDRKQLRGYGIALARRGYVCAAVEYRLSGEAKWPAQLHDVKAALRFVRSRSAELGIDPAKICVSGNSAGGHLALLLAGTRDQPEFEGEGGNPGVSSDCAACIAFYPPTTLIKPRPGTPEGALFAEDADEVTVRLASPVEHARKEFPPTQLLHGNRDQLVRPSASLKMYDALAKAGAPVELHLYNGAPHGFDASRELGRQCIELMALFLDRHVVNPRQLPSSFTGMAAPQAR